jgi:hypothetical protein
MKLTFFLIALFLFLLRICFPQLDLWNNGNDHGSMLMRSDNYIQEIKWSGKIRFSDDERSVAEITPGGYLKYRENDTTLKAASNLQGEISYTLYNGHEQLALNDSGRAFLAAQIQKMIQFGFGAEGRAERIYKKGGVTAVLAELSRIKMEGARDAYLDLLLKGDSLTSDETIELLRRLDDGNNSTEAERFLKRFRPDRLRDSAVAQEWLRVAGHLNASYMEKELLLYYLRADTASNAGLPEDQWDSVLAITGRFNASYDEKEVYERMVQVPVKTDAEWVGLIGAVGSLDADYLKTDLLVAIAAKMPRTDSITARYRLAAKTLQADMDYGKVMRAVE